MEEGAKAFSAAKSLDACKLNLGGSSRFLQTQLNATRKSLLYSDTVLIPDPIMPWLEKNRDEERFSHIIPLQMAFFLLHLSDLKGNEFDMPPFLYFQALRSYWKNMISKHKRIAFYLYRKFFHIMWIQAYLTPEKLWSLP